MVVIQRHAHQRAARAFAQCRQPVTCLRAELRGITGLPFKLLLRERGHGIGRAFGVGPAAAAACRQDDAQQGSTRQPTKT
ncbi:hypothetical protein D3C86_1954570 [compost metagenome]